MDSLTISDYVSTVQRHIKAFILSIVFFLILGGVITYLIPESYTSTVDFYITQKETDSKNFFTYNGYYSTQAAVDYTSTVSGFLLSNSALEEAAKYVEDNPEYISGGYSPTVLSGSYNYLVKFSKSINTKILAPQIVSLSINTPQKAISQIWTQAELEVITQLNTLNSQEGVSFIATPLSSVFTETISLNLELDLLIGTFIGIFVGILVAFILESRKNK